MSRRNDAEPTVAVVAYHWAVTHFGSARGRDRKDDHGLRQPAGDRRRGGAGISLSRRHGYLGAHAPRPTTLRTAATTTYQAVGKLKGDVDLTRAQAQMRTIGDALARQYPENRLKTVDRDSAAGAADRQPPGDVVGADERRGRRLAHRVRQYREPPAGAGRGQDARDRAPRRARRRPGPCGAATADRKLRARGRGRAGRSPAGVDARAGSRGVVTRQPAPHRRGADGHDRPPVRARALAGVDGALRARAGPACLATRPVGCVEAGRLEGDGVEGRRSAPLGAGRGRSGVVGHPAGGRGAAAAIVPGAPARRPRVHDGPCAGGLHGIRGQGRRPEDLGLGAGSMPMCSTVCVPCPG